MKVPFHTRIESFPARLFLTFLLPLLLLSLASVLRGQAPPPMSLTNILTGLRSKKVSLIERNTLLTDAVLKRGIIFRLTPKIAGELINNGAGGELIWAIRQKNAQTVAIQNSLPKSELRPDAPPIAAPISPAVSPPTLTVTPSDYEKAVNFQKAVGDYQKAFELDANNEAAKNGPPRLPSEQSENSVNAAIKQIEETTRAKPPIVPPIVELGELNQFAVKLVTPFYPDTAQKFNTQGKVLVQITLDRAGNVISAKAVTGHMLLRKACEDAAFKSKFKFAHANPQTMKATGFINYNFVR